MVCAEMLLFVINIYPYLPHIKLVYEKVCTII